MDDSFEKKLDEKERAEESVWFSRRDRELIDRIRTAAEEERLRDLRDVAHMRARTARRGSRP